MEIVDLYNNKRQKLDKRIIRKEEPSSGEYKLVVHVWILNSKGELLIQKRSENTVRHQGKWGFTGGAVDTNETSLEGALRETSEELGVTIFENDIEFLLSFKREKTFVDVWLVKKDINLEDVKIQEEEVSEVKYVTLKELIAMNEREETIPSTNLYIELLSKLLVKCHNVNLE